MAESPASMTVDVPVYARIGDVEHTVGTVTIDVPVVVWPEPAATAAAPAATAAADASTGTALAAVNGADGRSLRPRLLSVTEALSWCLRRSGTRVALLAANGAEGRAQFEDLLYVLDGHRRVKSVRRSAGRESVTFDNDAVLHLVGGQPSARGTLFDAAAWIGYHQPESVPTWIKLIGWDGFTPAPASGDEAPAVAEAPC